MDSNWKHLPLSNSSTKVLLYKIHFTSDSYAFQVTDLNHLWIESLSRKELVRRALTDDISIDLSDGSEQQRRLLFQHLSSALTGKPDTKLEIEKTTSDAVHILATTKLPGNLPPLEWKLTPCASTQATLAHEFVLPALQSIVQLKHQSASLIEQLREKDRVISKLISKLNTSGIELATAFPNTQFKGSRTSSREAIAKAVKGLGEFDESKWRVANSSQEASDQSLERLLDVVLPFEAPSVSYFQTVIEHEPRNSPKVSSEAAQKAGQTSPKQEPSITNDNLSQKQATPGKDRFLSKPPLDTDGKNRISSSQTFQAIGRDDDTASEDSGSLEISVKPKKSPSRFENKSHTASSSDSETGAAILDRGKRRLGVIGGKKPNVSSSEEDDFPPVTGSSAGKRTFGRIGGNAASPMKVDQGVRGLSKTVSPLPLRSPASSREVSPLKPPVASNRPQPELSGIRAPPELPQETLEEKAHRKRQEAKEIESRKAPVKKKRKF